MFESTEDHKLSTVALALPDQGDESTADDDDDSTQV